MSLLREPRRTPRRPYPPRPARPPLAEPTIDWRMRAAVALVGARRLVGSPSLRRRLEMTGLTWDDLAPVLTRVRTVESWMREMAVAAEKAEAAGDWRRAAAFAFLAQLILSPYHPAKAEMAEQARRCHRLDRSARTGFHFERLSLCGGALAGYAETPDQPTGLPILLLPPLASTKEDMTPLADPLLAAGHPVLRFDLPGQGESPAPLTIDAERLLARGLDEMGIAAGQGIVAGGISLGACYALRLANADPGRVRGAFGVSPPAIETEQQWARQHEVIWQYLDRYFATRTREETFRLGLSMRLGDAVAGIACPVRLYHASRDVVSLPDAPERYRAALAHAPLTDRVLQDLHGCAMHLRDIIAPEVAEWAAALLSRPARLTGVSPS